MGMRTRVDERQQRPFASRVSWRRWLHSNHASASGVWLQFHKKNAARASVTYPEAVEEALCFGWIDGIVKSLDEQSYVQLFTPRKPKSTWSRSNKARVERLIAAGLMTAAGLEKIELARHNGSWESLDSVEALEVPDDLRRALARNRKARENFEKLSPSRKKQLLYRVNGARRPETRRKRIREVIAAATANRPL